MVLLLVTDEEMNQRDIKWPTQDYIVRAWLSLGLKEAQEYELTYWILGPLTVYFHWLI